MYYFINETLADPEVAMSKREILSENVIESNGLKLLTVTFKQVLQDFGVKNWNGRIYDQKQTVSAINSQPLIQNDIKNKTWTGEYGHPIIEKGMNELARQMTIFPPNACWTIDKYWEEGNILMGQCTTLSGGYGDLVRDRIFTNYPAQASSRAIGGVDSNGRVLPNYTPITYDCVIRPSHKVAYMVKGSETVNQFPINTGKMNTMSESVVAFDPTNDATFADFILSENSTKSKINMLCDTFKIDASSMKITSSDITFTTMNENGIVDVRIPIRQIVGAEYYNLFK